MTHTNHRQGTAENLKDTFVVLAMASRGINDQDTAGATHLFLELAAKYNPVNAGNMLAGNMYTLGGIDQLSDGMRGSIVHAAFNNETDLIGFLTDLKDHDYGLSVVISGLMDQVKDCCQEAGLHRHTVEYSLGVWGRTDRLPDPEVLEITTMCGHGQVAFSLVKRMVKDVITGSRSLDEAAMELTKPCVCGIFDPTRAKRLLEKMVVKATKPAIQDYIGIDPSKCDRCYACEVACAESHPDNDGLSMCIVDATLGPSISLHCQHCENASCLNVCPTGNIVRNEETKIVWAKGNKCIGCKMCVSACPFGMIVWNSGRGIANKCDLCRERIAAGEPVACVAACPTGALYRAEAAEVRRRQRELALRSFGLNSEISTE